MKQYSPFDIAQTFEKLWETWPRQEGESSGRKAVTHFLKSGNNKQDLLNACEAYRLENINADPSFTYTLSNFINKDYWLDVLESSSLDRLKKKRDDAIEVIKLWNDTCKDHWIKCIDPEIRVGMVQKALAQKYFRDNWKEALYKASKIFIYKFREGDTREKLKLNLKWFTNVDNNKHTILRLMEGEYGSPIKEMSKKIVENKTIDYEARQELARELKIMFPNVKFEEKKPIEIKDKKEKLILTPEAKAIADQIKSQLGKKPIVQYDKASIKKITGKITNELGDRTTEVSSEDDSFEFSD